ncbi:DNA replication protein psf2 [Malassezia cuniculi]|uniref:DNA replication complex GINS protein PSF2 n=1 Tax=Malassezia cuniculi TaxID=948313 RepID=A0AAF0EYR2_9BASI|nr:DNA replication protein psf2 [Malassezia cuniculi]
MALPAAAEPGILPTEMELLAGTETSVSILPLVSIDRVRLLSGTYGPFRPPSHAEVPLWLAIHLRRRQKCVIIPPDWLSVEQLTNYVHQESGSAAFAPVPLHYMAVSKMLLEHAADDIPSAPKVRALLKDLREIRQSKVLAGLAALNDTHIEMTNISSLEIAELRPFFATAVKHLQDIHRTNESTQPSGDASLA